MYIVTYKKPVVLYWRILQLVFSSSNCCQHTILDRLTALACVHLGTCFSLLDWPLFDYTLLTAAAVTGASSHQQMRFTALALTCSDPWTCRWLAGQPHSYTFTLQALYLPLQVSSYKLSVFYWKFRCTDDELPEPTISLMLKLIKLKSLRPIFERLKPIITDVLQAPSKHFILV